MDSTETGRAQSHAVSQIEATGAEVESIRTVRKSRDAYLCTVRLKGSDGERKMIVTRSEIE